MAVSSLLPSRGRALAILLLAAAPLMVDAAVLTYAERMASASPEPNFAERWLDGVFGRAASTPITATASDATAYLRIASLSIALYDFLTTIPAEWRLYASQPSFMKMSRACVLFILVRYVSVLALITSNVGFFGSGFSASFCARYQLVAPITKMLAVLVSQVIVSIRTYAISRKEPWVMYVLSALFVASIVPEFMGNYYKRKPVQNTAKNCTSGNLPTARIAWIHYLAAMIFDCVVSGISTVYLVMNSPGLSLMSSLSRLMLKEGIVFFVLLTGVNILNLVMFRVSSIPAQSSAACLGQAVTMIMSQRIILGLHDWRSTISPSGAGTRPDRYELSSNQKNGRSNILAARSTSGVETAVASVPGPNAYTNSTPLKSFVPNMRTSMEDMEGPIVHVHVHEDVKEDYDSVFASTPEYSNQSYHPRSNDSPKDKGPWTPM